MKHNKKCSSLKRRSKRNTTTWDQRRLSL